MTIHDHARRPPAVEPAVGAIITSGSGHDLVIRITGEFDDALAHSDQGDRAALAAAHAPGDVRVDLSAVTFMDSRAIGWLVGLRNATTGSPGRRVIVTDASRQAARILVISGMTHALGFTTCS